MASIFSKIINREIPGHFIYEDDQCAVILEKYPAVPGQCLVILKREVDYIFDLTEAEYQHLFATVKKVAHALDTTFNTERTCVVVEGFEVPHVHIKLYPMANKNENLGDVITRVEEATDAVLTALTEKIKQHL